MKKLFERIKKMSKRKKVQTVIALALTVALCFAIPAYSWFINQKKIAEIAKIKAPDELYINAAHKEDIINLDMSAINVSQKIPNSIDLITSQSFVFSISGEWVNSFTLQIEHTTNNPYTYTFHEGEIYKSESDMRAAHPNCDTRNTDGSLKYVEYVATNVYDSEEMSKITTWPDDGLTIETGHTYYIWIGDEIKNKTNNTGSYINKADGERYSDGSTLTPKSYESGTVKDKYADPVYWQLKNIKGGDTKGQPFYKTYVIKASWTGISDVAEDYNKETDIFYISAFVE